MHYLMNYGYFIKILYKFLLYKFNLKLIKIFQVNSIKCHQIAATLYTYFIHLVKHNVKQISRNIERNTNY